MQQTKLLKVNKLEYALEYLEDLYSTPGEAEPLVSPKPDCPDCGSVMAPRRPRPSQEWEEFWGCSRFKWGCMGKRNIMGDGTPEKDWD